MTDRELFTKDVDLAEGLLGCWEQGEHVELDDYLRLQPSYTTAQLTAVVCLDQQRSWSKGAPVLAEHYLQRYPAVAVDSECALDIVFQEFLIRERRGEQPSCQDFAARFPHLSLALADQVAMHQALESAPRPSGHVDSEMSIRQSNESMFRRVVDPLRRDRPSSDLEIQILLRKRLRLIAALSGGGFLLYLSALWPMLQNARSQILYIAVLLETAGIAVLLSSKILLSMGALRRIEVALIGGQLIFFACEQIEFFRMGWVSALSVDTWLGSTLVARCLSWPWAVMIIGYGILVPNTSRRCAIAVGIMATAFLAITLALCLTTDAPRNALIGFTVCSASDILFSAAIAMFGAYRIETLRKAAAETRRLGPYRVIRPLGAGSMGEVYLAEHALLRRPCALKLIRPERNGDPHFVARFEREVQTLAALTHPNTVRIYDYGQADDQTFYYAMEYLAGLSLQELVAHDGPLTWQTAVMILRQVCGALREAHAAGLVHRDVKPANILICEIGGMREVAKLVDFGLVRTTIDSPHHSELSFVGALAGTPAFMSPEQASAHAEVDARSDVYSLGAVAYFMLTGKPPFVQNTAVETMAAHLNETLVPPCELEPAIPVQVDALIVRCLEKDPNLRFADMAEVDAELGRCMAR